MTNAEILNAIAAASAARNAAQVARFAITQLEVDPEDGAAWRIGDQAYWLCRSAQEVALTAADLVAPAGPQDDDYIATFQLAREAAEEAGEAADDLVTLAEAGGREIRR